MRRLLVILFGLLLAGCAQPTADKTMPAGDPAATTSSGPGGVVNGQEPPAQRATPTARTFGPGVAAVDCGNCYEPTIAGDSNGRLFVADGFGHTIGVSEDGGKNWTAVKPPPVPSALKASRGDVILQVAPSGRLYWSAIVLSEGIVLDDGIQVAWSDDGAKTWSGNVYLSPATQTAQVVEPDRQWLGFAPDGTVYLTYSQAPTGIWFARSGDEGRTWTGWTRVAPVEARQGSYGQSGPPVVDSSGRVYVPACEGGDNERTLIFHSDNQGDSWTSAAADGGCSWFPILAARAGSLALSVQLESALVSVSTDRGTSFSNPTSWGSPTTAAAWPILTDDGELVLTWFEAEGETVALHVSQGNGSERTNDVVVARVHRTGLDGLSSRPALTDFASAALLPDGRLAVVYVEGNHVYVSVESSHGDSVRGPDASGMGF